MEKVTIIDFNENLATEFRDLNIAWLKKYFTVEALDEEMLSDPQQYIIENNGHIFFAQVDHKIAGTFALMKLNEDEYELAKMAVNDNFQGKKIGNKLLEFCLTKAKELGAKKIILFSNTMLGPAIHLYRKYGFAEVPLTNSEYQRSNIKMERIL